MLERVFRAATVQLQNTPDVASNLDTATKLIEAAAVGGAQFVTLPENAPYLGPEEGKLRLAEPLTGPMMQRFQDAAAKHRVWLLVGSFPEVGPDPQHVYNTSVLVRPDGEMHGFYRKIHLFDVETPTGQVLKESNAVAASDKLVVLDVGDWKIGLSICYDLRFPEMYRGLMALGATILTVPAAFTAETGRDHWLALLRARAIENLAYVIAPNQFGHHCPGRHSYGRSAMFDPWGTMLACNPDRPSVAYAEFNLNTLEKLRTHFPCLQHRRL